MDMYVKPLLKICHYQDTAPPYLGFQAKPQHETTTYSHI